MSDTEKTYYLVNNVNNNKVIYEDKGMHTFDGIESALSKNGRGVSGYIYQLIEDETGKQYIAPRKRYDSAMIDDSGKRVIYDEQKLILLLGESFAQTMILYEQLGRFLKYSKENPMEYEKFVSKHIRAGRRVLELIFPNTQAPILNKVIDDYV